MEITWSQDVTQQAPEENVPHWVTQSKQLDHKVDDL